MIDDRHVGGREGGEGMSQREQQALTGEGGCPQASLTALTWAARAKDKAITSAGGHTLSDIKDPSYQNNSVLVTIKCPAWQKEKMLRIQFYYN